MLIFMTSQGLAEYVGVTGGGIAAAAQGLQRTLVYWVQDRPLVVAAAVVAFVMLFWLTRSHAR